MSSLIDLLSSKLEGGPVARIGEQLGRDARTTQGAINLALPMLLGALKKSTARDGGAGLAHALETKHDGGILDNISGYLLQNDGADGGGILNHVLGSKLDKAAAMLQSASGVNKQQSVSLLTTLAPIVMGALGKARQAGNDGGQVARMLEQETQVIDARSPGALSALTGFLDADGDGETDLVDLVSHGKNKFGGLFAKANRPQSISRNLKKATS